MALLQQRDNECLCCGKSISDDEIFCRTCRENNCTEFNARCLGP